MGGSNSAQVQGSISCAVHPQGLGVFRHLFVEAFLFCQKPPKSACSSPQPQHRTGFLAASRACTAAHFYPCSAMRSGVAKQRRLLATHFARGRDRRLSLGKMPSKRRFSIPRESLLVEGSSFAKSRQYQPAGLCHSHSIELAFGGFPELYRCPLLLAHSDLLPA